jgi:hypothetical protein
MASARDCTKVEQAARLQEKLEAEEAKKPQKVFGRMGPPTKTEKDFVQQFVEDMPGPITESQTRALAKTMRRDPETVARWIEEAGELFAENARFYIETHRNATAAAAAMDSAAGQDVAIRASQWAIEHLSGGGKRLVEKTPAGAPTGTRIMIGVKIGGANEAPAVGVTVDAPSE